MTTLAIVLICLAGLVVLVWAGIVLAIVSGVRRARRSRALQSAALRTRATLSVGRQRTVLKLRMRLAESVQSGRAAVDLAAQRDVARGELPRLFGRLEAEARTLDAQLRLMESETDRGVLARELVSAENRVAQVGALVRQVRSAVADALAVDEESLGSLGADLDREVEALYAGVEELHSLNGGGSGVGGVGARDGRGSRAGNERASSARATDARDARARDARDARDGRDAHPQPAYRSSTRR
ncbi:hypothetical protein [Subtercola sp. YIM 133946]|uniref:hypothetical protein n=1 Tax=Subtercola sp. YIM 133946 TaxID=3118909 RepID=UPI002F91EE8E